MLKYLPTSYNKDCILNFILKNSENNIFKIKYLIQMISLLETNIYLPIVINNELICDGIRRCKNQFERLKLFPSMKNETIIDIGCNTGYMLFQFKKMGAGTCIGIDNNENIIKIANYVKKLEAESDIKFICLDYNAINLNIAKQADNVLYLGMDQYSNIFDEIPNLLKLTKKRLFIESSNTDEYDYKKTKKEIKEWTETINIYGKATLLGFTDYECRGLVMVEK